MEHTMSPFSALAQNVQKTLLRADMGELAQEDVTEGAMGFVICWRRAGKRPAFAGSRYRGVQSTAG